VLLLAGVVRLGVIVFWSESCFQRPGDDPDGYVAIARHWRESGIYSRDGLNPTSYRPPGLVLLLWPLASDERLLVVGLASLHVLAGMGTSALTMRLARQWGGGPTAGRVAGFLVAIDPLLVGQSALIMSEPIFTLLMTAGLVGSMTPWKGWWGRIGTGLVWGLAGLTRPIAWPVLVWVTFCSIGSRNWRSALPVLIVAALTASGWVVRNELVWGRPILTTTHGGYTLWLGQNPEFDRVVVQRGGIIWPAESFDRWTKENQRRTAGLDEIDQDRFYFQQAAGWMKENPAGAWRCGWHHLTRLWGLAPARGPAWVRWGVGIFYAIFLGLAVLGWWRSSASGRSLVLGVVLIFSLVHAAYWSDMRMRAPLGPMLAVAASLAVAGGRAGKSCNGP
jgi:hypothetical protein